MRVGNILDVMFNSIRKIPLWVYLLLIGFGVFYTHEITVPYDMGQYMNYALNIVSGKGYTNLDGNLLFFRAPLFSMMIAASYLFLGVSPWGAFWVVRIFCIINPIMIYLLGKKLYGKWVGFSGALLVLTSYSIHFWSYRHIDAVWPFFVFLAIYLMYEGIEKDNNLYTACAGLSMGFGYLVKEVTLSLFAIPIMLMVFSSELRQKGSLKYIVTFYTALFITISPWLIYLMNHGGISFIIDQTGKRLATMSPTVLPGSGVSLGPFDTLVEYLKGLFGFYDGEVNQNAMTRNFMLAPLFIVAWSFIVFRTVKGDKASTILLCSMMCFLPVICLVGKTDMRVGQGLWLYYFSYLALAYFLWGTSGILVRVKDRIFSGRLLVSRFIIFIMLVGTVCGAQLFLSKGSDRGGKIFLKRSYFCQIACGQGFGKKIRGNYEQYNEEAGEWIKNNIPAGSKIMADRIHPLYFYSGGEYTYFSVPTNVAKMVDMHRRIKDSNRHEKVDRRDVIFMSSFTGIDDPKNYISVLSEEGLLSYIGNNEIECIIIQRRRNYLSIYFDNNEGFLKVKEFGNGSIKIYRVVDLKALQDFQPMITVRLSRYLKILRNEEPDKFEWYVKNLFEPVLGWNYKDAEKLTYLTNRNELHGFTVVRKGRLYRTSSNKRM